MSAEPEAVEETVPVAVLKKRLASVAAKARAEGLRTGFKAGVARTRAAMENGEPAPRPDDESAPPEAEDAPPAVSSYRFDTPSGLPAAALFHLGGGSATTEEESESNPEWLHTKSLRDLRDGNSYRGRLRYPPEPPENKTGPPKGAPAKPTTIRLED